MAQPDLSAIGEAVYRAGDGIRQVLRAARRMIDLSGLRVTLELTELADGLRMRRGMPGHLDMQHFTVGVADHEEGMEGPEP